MKDILIDVTGAVGVKMSAQHQATHVVKQIVTQRGVNLIYQKLSWLEMFLEFGEESLRLYGDRLVKMIVQQTNNLIVLHRGDD